MLQGNRKAYLSTFRLDCGWQILDGMTGLSHYMWERIYIHSGKSSFFRFKSVLISQRFLSFRFGLNTQYSEQKKQLTRIELVTLA